MKHLTAETFAQEILHSKGPAIVMFYAPWCGKCAMMKPIFEEMEKKYQHRIHFYEVNIEESKKLADTYHAAIVPSFRLFRDGKLTGALQGMIGQKVFEQRIQNLF